MKKKNFLPSLLLLIGGVGLYTLTTWKWNTPIAAWVAPILLIRYFRLQKHWLATIPAALLLVGASWLNKTGGWDMEIGLELAAVSIAALPMIVALYLDRFASKKLPALAASLVFPAAFVALDYAVSFLPLGTVFSLSASQFYFRSLVQVASLTGVWGIEYIILWAAAMFNGLWEKSFNFAAARLPVIVFSVVFSASLLFGGIRLVVERPTSPTVKVAGITIAHTRDYWGELIDIGTPEDAAHALEDEMKTLEDDLFTASAGAAAAGAKIIFWSEADAFILPENEAAFIQRAQDFARQYQVYLVPAYKMLRYGDTSGYNGLAIITPQGEVAAEYEKTKSWYATTSDGVLDVVETPYGNLGAVICFDLDFPALVQQASQKGVDILLVPGFDTYETRVYHTEVGMIRAVENGMSIFRMVNEGTSMAVDARGAVLASQDFFTTPERILLVDLPTAGTQTMYRFIGEGFAWLCAATTLVLLICAISRRKENLVDGSE